VRLKRPLRIAVNLNACENMRRRLTRDFTKSRARRRNISRFAPSGARERRAERRENLTRIGKFARAD
jgi:hypothetical protein